MQIHESGRRIVSSPFPGLRSFEVDESHLFFGRELHTQKLLERLATRRFLAVVGTSGSGKSSLVRAGVVPALYRGHLVGAGSGWRIAVMRPGDSPMERLAGALQIDDIHDRDRALTRSSLGLVEVAARAGVFRESLLVVVDQFEELFRLKQQVDQVSFFVSALIEATQQWDIPIYVILTIRSDFLGECSRVPAVNVKIVVV